ncbi:MAG: DMT family transporter [Rhodospirillales bacterium]|nr:DMT family transporter [Rhodospirillales bacterium]
MADRRPLLHWLLLLALVAMWGSSFMFTKVALEALAPLGLVAARLTIGAALLVALLSALRRPWPGGSRLWLFFLAMALLGNALPFFLISWGQQRIDSGLAGILMAVMPLATLVLAHFLVEGEGLTRRRAGGFALGFLGIVALMGPEALLEMRGEGTVLLSQLAVLCGALCYAANTIVARRRPTSDPLVAAAGVTLLAAAVMLPAAAFTAPVSIIRLPLAPALALLALGAISTGLATVVYFKLVTLAGPTFLSLINYLIPIWAVAVGMIVLAERPEWTALAGLALILGGIGLSESSRRRSRSQAEE